MIGASHLHLPPPVYAYLGSLVPFPPANRTNMLQKFEETMLKMSLLGFDQSALTDCSDVIPTASGTVQDPFLPAGLTTDDLQPACSSSAFPAVSTVAGT